MNFRETSWYENWKRTVDFEILLDMNEKLSRSKVHFSICIWLFIFEVLQNWGVVLEIQIKWITQEYCHSAYFEKDLVAIKFIGFAQKETI